VADRGNHRLEIFDQTASTRVALRVQPPQRFFIKGNTLYVTTPIGSAESPELA